MTGGVRARLTLNAHEAATAAALFDTLFPADEHGPAASEIGVLEYVDRALAGAYSDLAGTYRLGLAALDRAAWTQHASSFAGCRPEKRAALVGELEAGSLPDFRAPPQGEFFKMLLDHLQEGLFADPAYGGNRDNLGWRFLGHPGVWLENSE